MSLVQPTESLAVLVAVNIAKLRHDTLRSPRILKATPQPTAGHNNAYIVIRHNLW
jgi:hypothetical protein